MRTIMEGLGQLFSKETQAIFYNWKEKPVQVGCQFDNGQPPRTSRESRNFTQITVPVTRSACWISTSCAVSVAVCGETIACAVPASAAGQLLQHNCFARRTCREVNQHLSPLQALADA